MFGVPLMSIGSQAFPDIMIEGLNHKIMMVDCCFWMAVQGY